MGYAFSNQHNSMHPTCPTLSQPHSRYSRFSPALTAFFWSSFCFTRSIHSLREVEGRMCSMRTLIFFLMILPFTCTYE